MYDDKTVEYSTACMYVGSGNMRDIVMEADLIGCSRSHPACNILETSDINYQGQDFLP